MVWFQTGNEPVGKCVFEETESIIFFIMEPILLGLATEISLDMDEILQVDLWKV